MIWTHIYDLLLKMATFGLIILGFSFFPIGINNFFILFIIGFIMFFTVYNFILRTLATFLYCKFTLKMELTLAQAKHLNNAFSPIFPPNVKWLPMEDLKQTDSINKYEIALETLNKWEIEKVENKRIEIQDFKQSSNKTKFLTVLMYIIIIYFGIASHFNLPPSNYLTAIFCKVFNTEKFYPVINMLILAYLTNLIFTKIDKNIKPLFGRKN